MVWKDLERLGRLVWTTINVYTRLQVVEVLASNVRCGMMGYEKDWNLAFWEVVHPEFEEELR